jgi:glycosyltransferase involved in cell wall biosynthesis
MRVLIVSHLALPHIGGVEVLVDREICALIAAGHEVALVTSDGAGKGQTPVYPPVVRVLRVPAAHVLERWLRLPYPLFSPRLLPTLLTEVKRSDVVHVHGSMFMNSIVALIVAWWCGRERVLTDHGGIQRFESWTTRLVARVAIETVGRLSARLATRLVSYNTRITGLLERLAGRGTTALFLPNPVDRVLFHSPSPEERVAARRHLGWAVGRPKVLFVGRLTPEKGVPLLLKATDARYDIVFCGSGDPGILGHLPRPGVEYLPARPQRELVRLYHAADVLAVPSDVREGFPVVVQEAVACGLNVLLSYDEGYEPYRSMPGLSFCTRDPEAIKHALVQNLETTSSGRRSAPGDLSQWCPEPDVWIRTLYGQFDGGRRPSSSRAFQAR